MDALERTKGCKLIKAYKQESCLLNAPINGLPQDGGVGQPRENLTFSGFEMSISPPLGLHCK